jgi:hypothetical protein
MRAFNGVETDRGAECIRGSHRTPLDQDQGVDSGEIRWWLEAVLFRRSDKTE